MTFKSLALALTGLGLLAGCSNYYQVRDPQSGNVYYTRMITDRVGGAVSFEDELTGRDVTLQQSEVTRIDGDIYKARTARVDRDIEVITVRPAGGAITEPTPDHSIQIRNRDIDLDGDVDAVEVDRKQDVRIRIDD